MIRKGKYLVLQVQKEIKDIIRLKNSSDETILYEINDIIAKIII